MAFDNTTNRRRVLKMLDTLALIEKSAKSNHASAEEMAAILRLLTDKLDRLGVTQPAMKGAPDA